MKALFFLFLLTFPFLNEKLSAQKYFHVYENQIMKFNGVFVPGSEKKIIKIPATFTPGIAPAVEFSDTLRFKSKVIYRLRLIENQRVYYSIDIDDTLKSNPYLESSNFLSSVFYFKNDSLFLCPVYKLNELDTLKLTSFKTFIPPSLHSNDTIIITHGKSIKILYDFHFQNVELNGITYNDCLTFTIKHDYPEVSYFGQVWLDKKYGVIKWVRSTGRIDYREF